MPTSRVCHGNFIPLHPIPWNKGKLVGQKAPLKLKDTWAIRVRLQLRHKLRDLALFNLAIDSKLRACDLIALRVTDIALAGQITPTAHVMQRKTHNPAQSNSTKTTRAPPHTWHHHPTLRPGPPH